MKYHFVINPKAGNGKKTQELSEQITKVCDELGVNYNVYLTKAPLDATEYVRQAALDTSETHRFYACGGDGTLCELINGAPNNDNVEFGLIPIGTGNDFRRNFDNKEMFFDIERQINGKSAKIDLLKCNGRYCVNIVNIGFDCNVVYEMDKIRNVKIIPNKLAYVAGIVVTLFKKMYSKMKITAEGIPEIDRELLLIAIANGRFYGGGFKAVPFASLHDGMIDISIIEKVSRLTFISLVGKYKEGTHLKTKNGQKCITYLRSNSLKLEFEKPIKICIDGEVETAVGLDIEIAPSATSFIIPDGVKELDNDAAFSEDTRVINCSSLI